MDSNELDLIIKFAQKFNELVDKRAQELINISHKEQLHSDAINELADAMSKAQGEYLPLFYNKTNPYERWEYNDLNAILKAVRPALTKYGVFFTQSPYVDDSGATIVHTILIHKSGQWISSKVRVVPSKNNQHETDSVLTFQKRSSACSLLGIAGDNDRTDDDAEKDMASIRNQSNKGIDINLKYDKTDASYDRISRDQLAELEYELQEFPDMVSQILKRERIDTLADLPKSRYRDTLTKTHEIKALRKGIKN